MINRINQKGFSLIIFLFLIIIACGGFVGGSFYIKNKLLSGKSQINATPSPLLGNLSPSVSPLGSPSSIAKIQTQCVNDNDCVIVDSNSNFSKPCVTACVNYTSSSAIAVNNDWLQKQSSGKCNIGFACTAPIVQSQYDFLAKCINSVCKKVATLNISSIIPTSGTPDTVVTIQGSGFTKDQNYIKFNLGYSESISSADGVTLNFKIPSSAISGCSYPPILFQPKPGYASCAHTTL